MLALHSGTILNSEITNKGAWVAPTFKGEKILDLQRLQEAVKHLVRITRGFKMLTVHRNVIINADLKGKR